MKKREKSPLLFIFLATMVMIVFKLFAVDILGVSGDSMEPALLEGQVICVNRLEYGLQLPFVNYYLFLWKAPENGDIVVFRNPENKRIVVKRCVGTGNDRMKIIKTGVYFGTKKIELSPFQHQNLSKIDNIPENSLFAVGDNYQRSKDSRDYGFIPFNKIFGKVLFPVHKGAR